ncbi:MAG: thioesterase family protein [Bifidobacteriaceae bacterium]|nr:thioesterase family protein [Bifidobacteriaceae bacterium]
MTQVDLPIGAAVTLATLESRSHEVNAIRSGIKLYKSDAVADVQRSDQDDKGVTVAVRDRGTVLLTRIQFRKGGADLSRHWCQCGVGNRGDLLCKHIVAAVLGAQGGLVDSAVTLGLTAAATTTVNQTNTAKAARSGTLEVFATPMLIALMEEAACACLQDKLNPGQTSVGTAIQVAHKAPSPIGAVVTATATLELVLGNRLEFAVAAQDDARVIADGRHTRVIVDAADFMGKATRPPART